MLGGWTANLDKVRGEFQNSSPFPHVVIDGFLDERFAANLLAEFPAVECMPRSRDYVFGNKHELSSIGKAGQTSSEYAKLITGDRFAEILSRISSEEVFVDPAFHGGGFHQGTAGSYLDLHVDFNVHPSHPDWLRRLNVLLYLTPHWDASYGGELLVTDTPFGETESISLAFNRAVIMRTDERTYHGYRRVSVPPGVTRKSIAAYAYTKVSGTVRAETTRWAPRRSEYGKRVLARLYNPLVQAKNRVFGSGTARNV